MTTARIELKQRTADGGIGVCRYCRRHLSFSLVDDVFDDGGAPSSFDRGHRRRGLVVSLPPSSLRGGAPNGDYNDEDKGDNDRDDNEEDNKDNNDQCG